MNASGGVPGYAMNQERHVLNYEGGLATNTMSTTCSCKKQYDKSNVCHMNGTVESCMAIYLGMAMEMP